MRLVLALFLALAAPPLAAGQTDLSVWIPAFRERALAAGIGAETFDAAMADIAAEPDTLRRDRNQAEFTKTIWVYLDTAVSDRRVADGRAAMARNAAALERIERQYGVPKEIVAAIWGLESSYGSYRGDVPTLAALATLAADSRRAAFFEEQLIEALRILDAGETTRAALRGSWAGAMGHTQFLPTSFRDHAVDFDGDGRRDLWGDDPTDALASTAAYLAANGWQKGQPWTIEVILPEGFDYLSTGERAGKPAAEWAALGVRAADGTALPEGAATSIRVPGGHSGAAFLSYPNFRVIESYNTADAYVIAVGHLADRLAGGGPLRGDWPEADRALELAERLEMQGLLRAAGFDPLKVDGKVGPDTMDAIQRWQLSKGLVPDGYASPALLSRLRD